MKIAHYCQHVLGIGHFQRSMEICRALARNHDVTMITGGAPLDVGALNFSFFQLPGLMMDSSFSNLAPFDTSKNIDDIKRSRKEMLYHFFQSYSPDVFLIELYPFGRKAFRFELDPVLRGIRNKELSSCYTICSLRDILVEREDKIKFEERIISTLNTYFDGLLIHGDEKFIPLNETFNRVDDIDIQMAYTGYISPSINESEREKIRDSLGLSKNTRLVVASIGGGNVGIELLFNLVDAFKLIHDNTLRLQIFTGPYATEKDLIKLRQYEGRTIKVERFTSNFPDLLLAADLSVSMAGYNTTMNILAAGVPALLYPFSQNHEQSMRVKKLKNITPINILKKKDLTPKVLAQHIKTHLEMKRFSSPIELNGSGNTAALIEHWSRSAKLNEIPL